ncbi:MAG: hypothetical protein SGI72_02305 [Planctomycetota bacterium]|nr:hypothetical protein [Planctomycetota bacterium]
MIVNWLLMLLLAPGWLLPSGVRVPLCACLIAAAGGATCCVAAETPTSCASARASESEEKADTSGPEARPRCSCAVAVPVHEAGNARILVDHVAPNAVIPAPTVRFAPCACTASSAPVDRPRARGPSPGGSIPLPLRL